MDNKDVMELRGIKKGELKARGCAYCADVQKRGSLKNWEYQEYERQKISLALHRCPHEECPYKELEHLTNYEAYCRRIEREENGGVMQLIRALIGSEP